MITIEKLRIYEKYNGDYCQCNGVDGTDMELLSRGSFDTIRDMLRKVQIVKSCLASQKFKEEFHGELDTLTDGKETIAYLFRMIKA